MAVIKAKLTNLSNPFHRDLHPLRELPDRDLVDTHQASDFPAFKLAVVTKIELFDELQSAMHDSVRQRTDLCYRLKCTSVSLAIRHNVRHRPEPRGVTPRRLKAAEKALAKERRRLALFETQVADEQPTPEQRIERFDEQLLAADQGHRDLAAKHWRFGRRQLAVLSDSVRSEIIARWNASLIPADAHYFADFVRRELRRRGLPLQE